MTQTIYDLIVIGGGSGGVRAARIAASLGAKVAIIEDTHWGGTCVNVGCVPKKIYHYAAGISKQVTLGQALGWEVSQGSIDWQTFHTAKDTEINRLQGIYAKLLGNAGCEVINGFGEIVDATGEIKTVKVNETEYQTKKILLATGCAPAMPDIDGIQHAIHSEQLFALDHLPKRLLVVGGGYIGCEMASIYHNLGAAVTLSVRSKLLKEFDTETVAFLTNELKNDGMDIQLGRSPSKIELKSDGSLLVTFNDDTQQAYDTVLMAAGRKPRFAGLGLEHTKVTRDGNGLVEVNDNFETAHAGIYAVGDIIAGPDLTPVALEQGMFLAKSLYDDKTPIRPAFEQVATAIFTHPQMASCGLSEEQVIAAGKKADVYASSFRHIKYSVTDIPKRTFLKLLVEQGTEQILGIQMVGDEVGEIMQGFSVLLHAGVTKTQLDQTIGIHPTVAEELVTMRQATRSVG